MDFQFIGRFPATPVGGAALHEIAVPSLKEMDMPLWLKNWERGIKGPSRVVV